MIKADLWKSADGLVLEPNAYKAAVEDEKSLALTAGPGAGKTEMLAQRADFLLRTGTCRYPKRILAISFKVDASSNLKGNCSPTRSRQLMKNMYWLSMQRQTLVMRSLATRFSMSH